MEGKRTAKEKGVGWGRYETSFFLRFLSIRLFSLMPSKPAIHLVSFDKLRMSKNTTGKDGFFRAFPAHCIFISRYAFFRYGQKYTYNRRRFPHSIHPPNQTNIFAVWSVTPFGEVKRSAAGTLFYFFESVRSLFDE